MINISLISMLPVNDRKIIIRNTDKREQNSIAGGVILGIIQPIAAMLTLLLLGLLSPNSQEGKNL